MFTLVYMEEDSQIRIAVKTKKQLDKFKVHPRESYDEVINRILDNTKYLGVEADD